MADDDLKMPGGVFYGCLGAVIFTPCIIVAGILATKERYTESVILAVIGYLAPSRNKTRSKIDLQALAVRTIKEIGERMDHGDDQ